MVFNKLVSIGYEKIFKKFDNVLINSWKQQDHSKNWKKQSFDAIIMSYKKVEGCKKRKKQFIIFSNY